MTDDLLAARRDNEYNWATGVMMPTIVIEGYKFRFYSSDVNEPPHVHVFRGENEAKIWLQPISVARNYGYHGPELNRIVKLT